MQQIYLIWSHQILPDKENVIYGRGSPEMDFLPEVANADKEKEFEGALPTTIYQAGFSEIYGQSPDIDSTGLIISTTSWILARTLRGQQQEEGHVSLPQESSAQRAIIASENSSDYVSALLSKAGITDPLKVTEVVVPRMLRSIEYLNRRDIDNDGLLEQNHNEDWMDTVLRAGKIVYSQACWLLALNDLSTLLSKLERDREANRLTQLADKTIHAIEEKLWSEEDGCYMDIEESHHTGREDRMITQDISLYLVALTENRSNDSFGLYHDQDNNKKKETKQQQQEQELNLIHQGLYNRATGSLHALRKRVWKDKWPLVTEEVLKKTAPWVLKPCHYHNHTCWPWLTGVEMLARSRFNQFEECDILLSKLASEDDPYMHTFYEWINPVTDEGCGAYPFRTGISTVRIALADIIEKIRNESSFISTTPRKG
jgi:Glycosyl-hydrolase family 116, catalytic region